MPPKHKTGKELTNACNPNMLFYTIVFQFLFFSENPNQFALTSVPNVPHTLNINLLPYTTVSFLCVIFRFTIMKRHHFKSEKSCLSVNRSDHSIIKPLLFFKTNTFNGQLVLVTYESHMMI